MPTFMQYAMAASHEALADAAWYPRTPEEQEMTVGNHGTAGRQTRSSVHREFVSAQGSAA